MTTRSPTTRGRPRIPDDAAVRGSSSRARTPWSSARASASREERRRLVAWLVGARRLPAVVDADALNCSREAPPSGRWATPERPLVLTPHPGEMARLAGLPTGAVQADRLGSARALAAERGGRRGAEGRAHDHRRAGRAGLDQPDRQPRHGERRHGRRARGHHRRACSPRGFRPTKRRGLGVFLHGPPPTGRRAPGQGRPPRFGPHRGAARRRPQRAAAAVPRRARDDVVLTSVRRRETEAARPLDWVPSRSAGDVIGLVGELGAGKTCLVRGLAAARCRRATGRESRRSRWSPSTGRPPAAPPRRPLPPASPGRSICWRCASIVYGPGVAAIEWFERLPASRWMTTFVVRIDVRRAGAAGSSLRGSRAARRGRSSTTLASRQRCSA